jgi:hypothetical protein
LRRPAGIAAESLKIRHPPMVDSPKPIKSRASPMRGGSTAVSSPESFATCSASVALGSGSDSVRDSVLACPSMAPVSFSNSRVLGAGGVSDGLASRTTSVIFSGLNIPAGPNHCGGSVGVVTGVVSIGSSAWAVRSWNCGIGRSPSRAYCFENCQGTGARRCGSRTSGFVSGAVALTNQSDPARGSARRH